MNKFKIGEKVYYDNYPYGNNINGVIIKDGYIQAVGKDAEELKKAGVSIFVPIVWVDNVRVRQMKRYRFWREDGSYEVAVGNNKEEAKDRAVYVTKVIKADEIKNITVACNV